MSQRPVKTEYDRKMLLRFIERHKLPFTVDIEGGRKRTTDQNRLQRLWIKEIAEQLPDRSAEEWRGYCKLHFGVPILRNEEGFCKVYDQRVRPLDYELKIALMMAPLDMPVTRLMSTVQKTAYLDAIYRHFSELGVVLTDPGDLLARAA